MVPATLSASSEQSQTKFGRAVVNLGNVDIKPTPTEATT